MYFKILFQILFLLSSYSFLQSENIKESSKAKSARKAYEKQVKSAELIVYKARIKYVKALKLALKDSTKKGDLDEAIRIRSIIEEMDLLNADKGKKKKYKLVIWNTHNGSHKDRGTNECDVLFYYNETLKWKAEKVLVPWKPDEDTKKEIPIPSIRFNRIRINITKSIQNGGGLSEIELFNGKKNLALKATATASDEYSKEYSATRAIDGNTSSSKSGTGYWLLKSKSGWIDLKFN